MSWASNVGIVCQGLRMWSTMCRVLQYFVTFQFNIMLTMHYHTLVSHA